ncbi:unnamed protein product [Ilex paraguariensis]|uniref:Disease resistance R13L4/SHOC-2-like LRR domain-containing protein n=1 Tax=Ilex paraguariensis TaxID=185542 RepID=A0ABC8RT19_9AQUA
MNGLMYLHMNNSEFSEIFPWDSLNNMTGLAVLSLGGDNPFDRTPFPKEVLKLTQLNWLYLSNCSIEGQIPKEIGNLSEFINLELSLNSIYGEIPVEITKLSNLWQLELFQNGLNGTLPVGFGNLTSLKMFDASNNYLTGDLSEVRLLNQLGVVEISPVIAYLSGIILVVGHQNGRRAVDRPMGGDELLGERVDGLREKKMK